MNVHIYGNLFRLVISSTIASTLFGEKKKRMNPEFLATVIGLI